MTFLGFLVLLLIAAIAGSLGQAIAGYSLGGCLMSIIVGFVGAFLGLWIARQFGLPEWLTINIQGESFPLNLVNNWFGHSLGCSWISFKTKKNLKLKIYKFKKNINYQRRYENGFECIKSRCIKWKMEASSG